MSMTKKLVEKYGLDQRVLLVPITCVSTGPLTITVAGGTEVFPARVMDGQTFGPGDVGMAMWLPPSPPICFKTTT